MIKSVYGSPPRAWGQCSANTDEIEQLRFTPTGVGTMPFQSEGSDRDTVHPHGRGDNNVVLSYPDRYDGSPPRAWGQCANG